MYLSLISSVTCLRIRVYILSIDDFTTYPASERKAYFCCNNDNNYPNLEILHIDNVKVSMLLSAMVSVLPNSKK